MIRGRLAAEALGNKIRVYFMQRGTNSENENVPVKVYRRRADEINFSTGMAGDTPGVWFEYIDNQQFTDERAELVFEGQLPITYSFCEYIDEDVEVSHTYIYWVTTDSFGEHIQIGPVACKLRDPEVWWSYDRAVREMKLLCEEYPSLITMECYGESTRHTPIYGLKVGNSEKTIALAGAVHASEPGAELLIKALRFILKTRPELLSKIGFSILPVINVDVRERTVKGEPFYLRKNPNDVDLNRNFDWEWCEEYVYGYSNAIVDSSTYHGPYAASENETKAAVRFMEAANPAALFVYDSCSVITEDWLLYNADPQNGEAYEYSNKIATMYSKAFRENNPECGTFTAKPISYPNVMDCFATTGNPHATFETWARNVYKIPSYSLQSANSVEGSVNSDDHVTLELLEQWSRRHAYALIAMLQEFGK